MNKFFFVLLLSLTISGCNQSELISRTTEVKTLRVVSKRPPKHFKITMVDAYNNRYFYSSKHCGRSRTYTVGTWYNVNTTIAVYKNKDGTQSTYYRLHGIC